MIDIDILEEQVRDGLRALLVVDRSRATLDLIAEVRGLREVCAAAYQMAGVVNAPLRFMDALSDAANGELGVRAPTDALLPVDPQESGCFPAWSDVEVEGWKRDAERYRRLRSLAHPSYNMQVTVNEWSASLARQEFVTVHAGDWDSMDKVLDGLIVVNTVNIKDPS